MTRRCSDCFSPLEVLLSACPTKACGLRRRPTWLQPASSQPMSAKVVVSALRKVTSDSTAAREAEKTMALERPATLASALRAKDRSRISFSLAALGCGAARRERARATGSSTSDVAILPSSSSSERKPLLPPPFFVVFFPGPSPSPSPPSSSLSLGPSPSARMPAPLQSAATP